MFLDIPLSDILFFAAVLTGGAVVAGFIAGLFGVGGGIVMVPILTELFGLGLRGSDPIHAQHIAVGTSLAIIIPTSLVSARTHYRSGKIEMGLLRQYLPFVVIGVIAGLGLARVLNASGLMLVFGVIALVVGLYQFFASPDLTIRSTLPGAPVPQAAGLFIGSTSTLMGIGGGVTNNVFMSLCGVDIKRAIATSAGVGVIISIPATAGFMTIGWAKNGLPPLSLGYVNLIALALMIPFTIYMAPIGARLTHRLDGRLTKRLFSLFLIVVALRTLWKVLAA